MVDLVSHVAMVAEDSSGFVVVVSSIHQSPNGGVSRFRTAQSTTILLSVRSAS